MSNKAELINNSNDWNKWIEEAISKKLIKHYEYECDATAKAIVHEIQLQREVDFHDNVIRFYGVTTSIKENQRKEYSLGLRETPIPKTPEDYIKIYTDCWNIEPDNRPTINHVVDKLKAIITKENIIIKDFNLYDNKKDIQLPNIHQTHQTNLDVEISENIISLHEDLSKNTTQYFNMMKTKEIDFSISSRIGTDIDKRKAFDLYQKATDCGNVSGINNLGHCYQNGIGIDIDKKKAFELYQKAEI
ncbi:kinase-like domain-containing protein [Rhizophagus irregularis DAOM 181602=DAOM 197198]|nr:kinase-like domain-containing protein [Rhizophagus irregularis DAOM 181602=DAOM 197198]